ncbi:23S rRNA pseudouridine synthase F, partial [Candidatus Falkowbacteria bacterium]|nr:23S rRNA pseudouridine synthase F [Candidatus Falkowbacteria bacterium]
IVNTLLKGENEVEKEYEVVGDKEFSQSASQIMKSGIFIDGHKTLPAKFVLLTPTKARITVVEGKNRLIRRLCEACGVHVKSLQRVRIGNLSLEKLKKGEYYEIPKKKLAHLIGVEL